MLESRSVSLRKREFGREGIEIPYPHMKVHLENPPKT
jgi:small-conductance mechanosensitive channel